MHPFGVMASNDSIRRLLTELLSVFAAEKNIDAFDSFSGL